jgi:hypothetical protein
VLRVRTGQDLQRAVNGVRADRGQRVISCGELRGGYVVARESVPLGLSYAPRRAEASRFPSPIADRREACVGSLMALSRRLAGGVEIELLGLRTGLATVFRVRPDEAGVGR